MALSQMNRILLAVISLPLYLIPPAYAQQEDGGSPDESLELRKIMRDMGNDMRVITGAISREDWGLIEKTSMKIVNHPRPPLSERIRILAFVGSDISTFKELDGKTHDSARQLGVVAANLDGNAVVDGFATLQKTCLACHQRFRQAFQKNFYGDD